MEGRAAGLDLDAVAQLIKMDHADVVAHALAEAARECVVGLDAVLLHLDVRSRLELGVPVEAVAERRARHGADADHRVEAAAHRAPEPFGIVRQLRAVHDAALVRLKLKTNKNNKKEQKTKVHGKEKHKKKKKRQTTMRVRGQHRSNQR